MFLDRLPPSLQQHLLLEWLSPESVWVLVRLSSVLWRCVVKDVPSVSSFQAAEGEVLSDACVRWFREQAVPLRLWSTSSRLRERPFWQLVERHFTNGKEHRDDDLPAVMFGEDLHASYWFQNGRLHRDGDKPAVVSRWSREIWYQNGQCHRDGDKPAIIYATGQQCWYQHGKLHRDNDRPAVVEADGTQVWYRHGKRHRDGDRPAEIQADGTRFWFQYDKLHRPRDAPAIIGGNGGSRWWFERGICVGAEDDGEKQPLPYPDQILCYWLSKYP